MTSDQMAWGHGVFYLGGITLPTVYGPSLLVRDDQGTRSLQCSSIPKFHLTTTPGRDGERVMKNLGSTVLAFRRNGTVKA